MDTKQKTNLICRMAGNIYSGTELTIAETISASFEIFDRVELRVKLDAKEDSKRLEGIRGNQEQ